MAHPSWPSAQVCIGLAASCLFHFLVSCFSLSLSYRSTGTSKLSWAARCSSGLARRPASQTHPVSRGFPLGEPATATGRGLMCTPGRAGRVLNAEQFLTYRLACVPQAPARLHRPCFSYPSGIAACISAGPASSGFGSLGRLQFCLACPHEACSLRLAVPRR